MAPTGWSESFACRRLSGSNHGDRSLNSAGSSRQLHAGNLLLAHRASIVWARTVAPFPEASECLGNPGRFIDL
jgi:hypothetical protein